MYDADHAHFCGHFVRNPLLLLLLYERKTFYLGGFIANVSL